MPDKKELRGAGVNAVFGRQIVTNSPRQQANSLASSHTGMPAKLQEGITVREKRKSVKSTYYIDPALIKPLKFLSVIIDKDLSTLVNEAIQALLDKHKPEAPDDTCCPLLP